MSRYNFRQATAFLNYSVPLSDLYEDVLEAMGYLSTPKKHLTKEDRAFIWGVLLTCADFLDTIEVK